VADLSQDLNDLLVLRSNLTEHLDRAKNAWIRENRHYQAAAELLCEELSALAERTRIWKNLKGRPEQVKDYPAVLASVVRELESILRKTGTEPDTAGQIVNDVLTEIDRIDHDDFQAIDLELGEKIRRAAIKICESANGANSLKLAWISKRGAAVASGAVILVMGLSSGEPTLIVVGAGLITSNAKLILDGADRIFPPGS